jgi:hypothetical protein
MFWDGPSDKDAGDNREPIQIPIAHCQGPGDGGNLLGWVTEQSNFARSRLARSCPGNRSCSSRTYGQIAQPDGD